MAAPAEPLSKALYAQLFPEEEEERTNTFAVLDGASIPDLIPHLYQAPRPEFACLYRGELEPDIAEVAPYLVRLQPGAPFTEWILTQGWGKHWGIFALTRADLKVTRRHFREFLMVKDPEGKQLYFRFYDPRVLRVFLPTCNAEELEFLFGPIACYMAEDKDQSVLLRFAAADGKLTARKMSLKQL